jgi:hypothetical protein
LHGFFWENNFLSLPVKIKLTQSYGLYLATSIVVSVIFTYYYFLYTHEYPPGSAKRIANFTADKVFQTRFLIPIIADSLLPLIPLLKKILQWIVPYPIDFRVILQIITVIALFLLLISLPKLLDCLGSKASPWLSLIILLPISWNYILINGVIDGGGLYYCYDIPSLTFFSIGLILFIKKKWGWFYVAFVLATLNRESSCFISMGGFLLLAKFSNFKPKSFLTENKILILHICIQAAIWISIKILLHHIFKSNPGEFFEEPHSMIQFLSGIGNDQNHWAMDKASWFLTLFMGVWLIPTIFYKYLSQQGRRFLLVGIIYILVLTFRSNMMETRVYNELNVVLAASIIICIHNIFFKKQIPNEVGDS